jgi:hypothetical protein
LPAWWTCSGVANPKAVWGRRALYMWIACRVACRACCRFSQFASSQYSCFKIPLTRSAKEYLRTALDCPKGVPGIIMTLHTFGEYLDFHPHLPPPASRLRPAPPSTRCRTLPSNPWKNSSAPKSSTCWSRRNCCHLDASRSSTPGSTAASTSTPLTRCPRNRLSQPSALNRTPPPVGCAPRAPLPAGSCPETCVGESSGVNKEAPSLRRAQNPPGKPLRYGFEGRYWVRCAAREEAILSTPRSVKKAMSINT